MPSGDSFLQPSPADSALKPVYKRLLIAYDDDGIHAGMVLHHHTMCVQGAQERFCWCIMPVSESLVNRTYSMTILKLLADALRYESFLVSLGVGSTRETWAKLILTLGWKHVPVPFFFLPVRTSKILGLPEFTKRPWLKVVATVAAWSGAGAIAGGLFALRRKMTLWREKAVAEVVPEFGEWADAVFSGALSDYPITALRNAACLNLGYPASDQRFIRLRVRPRSGGRDIGWVVVSLAQMKDHRHFGNLRVGVLVDGFGRTTDVATLVSSGTDYLIRAGVDIVVANWSHNAWRQASSQCGFLNGPSNYLLFTSTSKAQMFHSVGLDKMHFTRGDSDGMVGLRGIQIERDTNIDGRATRRLAPK